MKKVFTYLGCFLFSAVAYAQTEITQKLASVDSVSVARANNAIEKVLGVESEDITCLVFSIDKKVLLIHKTSEAQALELETMNEYYSALEKKTGLIASEAYNRTIALKAQRKETERMNLIRQKTLGTTKEEFRLNNKI